MSFVPFANLLDVALRGKSIWIVDCV